MGQSLVMSKRVQPTQHYTLSDLGSRKRYHAEFTVEDAQRVFDVVCQDLPQPANEARQA